MKIGPSTATTAAITQAQSAPADRKAYQLAVLKKALESQRMQADQLVQLIETKGKVVDIKA